MDKLRKLTDKQDKLLLTVAKILDIIKTPNTHQINEILGNRQAYESDLRDRLFRLNPYLVSTEVTGKHGNVLKRTWALTELGKTYVKQHDTPARVAA